MLVATVGIIGMKEKGEEQQERSFSVPSGNCDKRNIAYNV
jgi:hypothetical protein